MYDDIIWIYSFSGTYLLPCAKVCVRAGIRVYLRDEEIRNKILQFNMNIAIIPKNMPTNFELKQLKPKLDIVKKPENRVHELTDSNVSLLEEARKNAAVWF